MALSRVTVTLRVAERSRDAVRQTQQGTAFEDVERTKEGWYLRKVAHVDQCPADRAISEMIGLGVGNAVRIEAASLIARQLPASQCLSCRDGSMVNLRERFFQRRY